MQNQKVQSIKYIMLVINIIAVLFVTFFIYYTTKNVCDFYIAREFLDTVKAIPGKPDRILLTSIILLLLLAASFLTREFFYVENPKVRYATLLFDCIVSMLIVSLLDFNYNAILFWIFANVVSHIRGTRGRYLFMFLAIVSFVGTDFELISINSKLFSVNDYISYYDSSAQQYLLGLYNLLISFNIIVFIIFCTFVIQEQRGTIDEVSMLYSKLSDANGELQNANEELQKYAIMKEKMGETKERNRLAREIHDTLGHTLTGISAGIDACITTIDKAPGIAKQQLEVISNVTREGIQEVRRSVNELRPDALERLSLEYAINKMIANINSVTSIKVHFDSQINRLSFDEDEENAIYRVIQESVTNSIRHGKAKEVWIVIKKQDSDIYIKISDDGVGCKEMKYGFGTTHIKERIEMLNGTVSFDGSDGFVTEVTMPIRWGEEYD